MRKISEMIPSKNNERAMDLLDQNWASICRDPLIVDFCEQYPQFPKEKLRSFANTLRQLITERDNCARCPGLALCPNRIAGYTPRLVVYAENLDISLTPCAKLIQEQQRRKNQQLIKSHNIPKQILGASLSELDVDKGRLRAIEAAVDFCSQFAGSRPKKGLYLYGPLGVGKSYIAGAIANELVKYGVASLMLYVPEFIREISDAIWDHSVSDKLQGLKQAPVLILDDIGAEFLTPWKRDEVLGAVLQYRASEQLPTIYTSNMDLEELEQHFAHTNRGEDLMKAKRLMERIRHYVIPISVEGVNRRSNVTRE